jgi:hypothetical protein
MAEVKNICLEALERHCSSGETGRLDFRRGPYEGQIFMQDRLLVHAQLAGLDGVPALFRLFDWGDAETTWNPGVTPEQPSLHLPLGAAIVLYAEHLRDRASLEAQERQRVDQELGALEQIAGQAGGVESILKHYTVCLECADPTLLPDGFKFADSTKSSYVIGSSEDCDVVLHHPSVEPLHCGVILEKGSVYIWDLGAQSGVKLNGATIGEGMLKVGDVMTLGAVDLNVRFLLRRPNLRSRPPGETKPLPNPAMSPTGTMVLPKTTAPKGPIKGPITYDKVSRQLKDTGKGKPFLAKLGSLFGSKDRK